MKKISANITYKEATKSITAKRNGIDNTPSSDVVKKMRYIARYVFEPLREAMGNIPIGISSFFRAIKLNIKIGGSDNSQHCHGEAMDIDADIYGGVTNAEIFHWLRKNAVFDQLIWEYGTDQEPDWVHVSRVEKGNRGEVLFSYRDENNDVQYKYYNAA
jgi:hypothetical protein